MRLSTLLLVYLSLFVFCLADEATVTTEEETDVTAKRTTSEDDRYKGAPSVSALLAFTNPPLGLYSEPGYVNLPAGKRSSVVVSLSNNHDGTSLPRFTLDFIESALHYPMYYDYRLQNFSRVRLQNTIEPGQEASITYNFKPAVELAGRSFDLSIVVYYHDENGVYYAHGLFNQTVNLYEVEEGVDTQMIFLVVLVVALSIAVLVGVWHWCTSKVQSRSSTKKSKGDTVDSQPVNEYAILVNSKPQIKRRSEQTVQRRHGKR